MAILDTQLLAGTTSGAAFASVSHGLLNTLNICTKQNAPMKLKSPLVSGFCSWATSLLTVCEQSAITS